MNPDTAPPISPASSGATVRVSVAGKFLARDGRKLFLNGVSYGPFAPNTRSELFPEDEQLSRDFAHIRVLGFNTVRRYELPTDAVLLAAEQNDLLLIIGIPWTDHVDFLPVKTLRSSIEQRVCDAAHRFGTHPNVAALLVGNEIEKTLVRWMGPRKVRDFLERLIGIAKFAVPQALVSYATYPSTEYLIPRNADFIAVNVYLEERPAWDRYLLRLQNLAGNRPLVITEFGLDAHIHGDEKQADVMRWQRESLLRIGAAGNVWFSYTDDWQRGGKCVEDWHFGLVDRERKARAACVVAATLPTSPAIAAETSPRISVIVCTRNGSATLRPCLTALGTQTRPAHEVLVIDDGSIDDTPDITRSFPFVRLVRQEHAGLGAARNRGAHEASGEILAYTDDDCIPDDDWLLRLGAAYDNPMWVAAGGPNIPPPPRTTTEAVVATAPGAPIHVLLNDEEAEHLPGCNFSVRKDALLRIGGFHHDFTTAGDDVDICWRLRAAKGKLRFVPAAMVWHHRRISVRGYLRQQSGYGAAEALLMKHHPSHFGPLGGARWRGAIYGDGLGLRDPAEGSIYHGPFGFAPFQAIYPHGIAAWWELFTGVIWIALASIALILRWPSVAALLLGASAWAAWARANQNATEATPRGSSRHLLLWLLCWLQPIVREWARLRGMLRLHARPSWHPSLPEIIIPRRPRKSSRRIAVVSFWSDNAIGREQWLDSLRQLLAEKKIIFRNDDGWRSFDIELVPEALISWAFVSMTEYHGGGRQLTRVAILQRIRKRAAVVLLAGCCALYLFITKATLWFGFHSEVMILVLMIFQIITMHFLARGHSINLVHQAAERIGLKRLEKNDEDAWRQTSLLAVAEDSRQNS